MADSISAFVFTSVCVSARLLSACQEVCECVVKAKTIRDVLLSNRRLRK